jgi:hypothetical protein
MEDDRKQVSKYYVCVIYYVVDILSCPFFRRKGCWCCIFSTIWVNLGYAQAMVKWTMSVIKFMLGVQKTTCSDPHGEWILVTTGCYQLS